ncbi:MAG: cytochrome c biogenesis protein CcdA [Treponema sp.]|nr:cytochrome c biogenesis protein CcdA [Treponema sp.]
MQYLITFLEGLISFISPCMLPLLPMYISYFSGSNEESSALPRTLFFVLGFTLIFVSLGVFAGSVGAFLADYRMIVSIVCGSIIIILGLSYFEILHLPFFTGMENTRKVTGCFSAFIFGMIYSVSLTPCVGAFLGSALMLASDSANWQKGLFLLLCYSAGLGIPFILSALLLEKLRTAFNAIKKHYRIINIIAGSFLILLGIVMIVHAILRNTTI